MHKKVKCGGGFGSRAPPLPFKIVGNGRGTNFYNLVYLLVLFLIYFPMAAGGYFALGELVQDNIVLSMSDGWERVVVEIMLLLHLVSAFPIITNPPAQIFEEILSIPSGGISFMV